MEMAKKKAVALVAAFLALVMAFAAAGCGTKGTGKDGAAAKKKELLFATGGTAGTYYPLGGAIAKVWNSNVPSINVTVQSSGASVENLRLLDKGDADLALAMTNVADDAFKGKGQFSAPLKNFKAVGVVYPDVVQAIVAADSNVKTIQDLKGKKVAVGPTGSGTEVTTRIILAAYGLNYTERKDLQPVYATYADAVDQFKDGHLDSVWNVLAVPAAAIQDITTTKGIRFLSLEGPEYEKLLAENPLLVPYEIPAGTYKGQDKPVKTVAINSALYARADLPEDLVYQLTKVLYEKKDEIAQGHDRGRQIDLQKALAGITTPVHPGAAKYYAEKGIKLP